MVGVSGGGRDGNYDAWDPNTDLARQAIIPDSAFVSNARFGTPLLMNVTATQWSQNREDLELVAPRVKNANFTTVGEIVDVPFYYSAWPDDRFASPDTLRPTAMWLTDAAMVLELVSTSRLDLTLGTAEVLLPPGPGGYDPDYTWFHPVRESEITGGGGTRPDDPAVACYAFNNNAWGMWEWDADDGLENGVYALYVYVGEFAQRVAEGVGRSWVASPDRRPVSIEVFSDRDGDNDVNTGPDNNPDSFGIIGNVVPRLDGVISYGVIEVSGNRLILRLLNDGEDGAINTFTRIALAPLQRDHGKININSFFAAPLPDEPNVLAALPGLNQIWDGTRLLPSPDTTDTVLLGRAKARANAIIAMRQTLNPAVYTPFASIGDLLLRLTNDALWAQRLDSVIGGGGSASPEEVMNETLERFKHISNLITVRSDVFEIFCTAQAGTVIDANNDRRLLLRDDDFMVAAEKKLRLVYER
jgi:hypothetical protein